MATSDRCPKCGAMVLAGEHFCPQCGAPLDGETPAAAQPANGASQFEYLPPQAQTAAAQPPSGPPRTIEELKAFCAYNEMPLEKMRFFVGINYRQPRAFGIYRDGDNFVVYKNKDNGSRAVRYHGPDEAFAVKELYNKLLDECHARNIWPDGKPEGYDEARRKAKRRSMLILVAVVVFFLAIGIMAVSSSVRAHRYDGYYRFGRGDTYYRYADTWYYYDTGDTWVQTNDYPYYDDYDDYYLGNSYDRSWGGSDFKSSQTWENIQEQERSHTSSSDYDSWDSGGTDWSSDW
ncbi:MAG: zinc-ribbon domain-containing protein [Clostridia bacterium]|nr:zinc-ribbon domain-containing protein [Clostridia bacterium]